MLADLPGERLEVAAGSIRGALAQSCDVSDPDQVEALADAAFEHLGEVHLLLNNAGVSGPRGRLWEVDPEAARAHFDINFWGVWNACRAFASRLAVQSSSSAIYNTGSENSFFCAVPQSAAYIAAKHAVLGMTESMREDLPPHVHLGTLLPGWVFTAIGPQAAMQHGMDVDQFARIVVPQILARERFVVSHYSNVRRIRERIDPLLDAYEAHAPRDAGDDAYDVRDVIARLTGDR